MHIRDLREALGEGPGPSLPGGSGDPFRFDRNLWKEVRADAVGQSGLDAVSIAQRILEGNMSPMTSAQRIFTTLSHQEPDRVPLVLTLTIHGARRSSDWASASISSPGNVVKASDAEEDPGTTPSTGSSTPPPP